MFFRSIIRFLITIYKEHVEDDTRVRVLVFVLRPRGPIALPISLVRGLSRSSLAVKIAIYDYHLPVVEPR